MFYISPGILEGALRAPWDYRRITVRLPLTIARCPSDFPLIMAFKIVRKPSGSPTVRLRAFYGLLRVVYGLSAVVRSHENAGKIGSSLLSTPTPARLVKTLPGPLRIVGHPSGTRWGPYGHRTEMAKITVFTRRTGPLMDMWQPHKSATVVTSLPVRRPCSPVEYWTPPCRREDGYSGVRSRSPKPEFGVRRLWWTLDWLFWLYICKCTIWYVA